MMLVWGVSRVLLAREELGQDQDQDQLTKIEMVAMLDVRHFLLLNILNISREGNKRILLFQLGRACDVSFLFHTFVRQKLYIEYLIYLSSSRFF